MNFRLSYRISTEVNKRLLYILPLLVLSVIIAIFSLYLNSSLLVFSSLGLIFSAIGLLYPRYGLYAFLLLIPLADFAKRLLLIDMPVSDFEWNFVIFVPDMILLSSTAGVIIWTAIENKTTHFNRLDLLVAAYFLWQIFSVFNPRVPLIIGLAGFKLSALYILVYFLGRILIRDWTQITQLAKITLYSAVFSSLYGVYQVIFGLNSFEKIWFYEGYTTLHEGNLLGYGFLRPFSTFSDPGSFSQYLAITMLLILLIAIQSRVVSTKIFILFVEAILGAMLLATVVRAGWILLAAGVISLILFYSAKFRRFIPWLVWVTLLSIPLIGQRIQRSNFISNFTNPLLRRALTTGTLFDRLQGWENAIRNPGYRPIWGNGLGTIGVAAQKFGGNVVDLPHNQFLTILSETGWIGLIIFLLIILLTYKLVLSAKPKTKSGWKYPEVAVLISVVTGLLVMGASVSEFLFLRTSSTYFWLFLGILPQAVDGRIFSNKMGRDDADTSS
jgi:O-antigen ligase